MILLWKVELLYFGHRTNASPTPNNLSPAAPMPSTLCSFQEPFLDSFDILNCDLHIFEFSQPLNIRKQTGFNHSISGMSKPMSGTPPIPIFILFSEKISVLLETLRSYHRYLKTPFEIIILDSDSKYPRTIAFLSRLKESGMKIYHVTENWNSFNELHDLAISYIERYMEKSESQYYIFTDADCALDSAPSDILDVYKAALDNLGYNLIGAAIRWDDISSLIRNQSTGYLYLDGHDNVKSFKFDGRIYYYAPSLVDTTFAMARRGYRLTRLKQKSVRMLSPLAVRHLDFYYSQDNLPEDYVFYLKKARRKNRDLNHMDVFRLTN
jgi:hypothetical protein